MTDIPGNPDDKKPKGLKGVAAGKLRQAFGLAKHTAGDLKKPKEIGLLLTAVIVPGGFVGYAAYRLKEYRNRKPAINDNATPPRLENAADPEKPKQDDHSLKSLFKPKKP